MSHNGFRSRITGRSKRSPILALGIVALLAACTVGPDFAPPQAPPDNGYTGPGEEPLMALQGAEAEQEIALGERISGGWWALFRSKSLNDVLQQALVGNRSLAAAKATLAQAQEAVGQAAGALWPQVNFSASAGRQQTSFATQGIDQRGAPYNLFSVGPNASYNLDLFGGNARRVEQQEALAEFQGHQLNAAYLTLTGNAVTQAIQIASLRAQIKVVQEIIAHDEENLRAVRAQLGPGEATRLDLQAAASQLSTDRTQLPPLRQQLSVARHALSVLTGKAPAEWTPPEFELDEFVLPKQLPVSLPSQLVRQRPDILAAEAQLHAASAAIGVAEAQQYPNITLSASLAQQALSAGSLFGGANTIWSLASNLTAPIFQGGALEAQQRAAEAGFEEKLATYQQTVLQAFGQVADLLQAIAHDSELVNEQRRAVETAQASLSLTRSSYALGNATLLQVLDAERLYQQARLGHVKALAQRHLDTTQLFVAMGGGWWDWRAAPPSAAPVADSAAPGGGGARGRLNAGLRGGAVDGRNERRPHKEG